MMMMILLLVILIPLFLFIFLGRYSSFSFRKLPPGPNTFQLIRKLSSLPKKPHVAFDDLSKIYGPLMSFRLGGRLVILASSPSISNEIIKTNNRFVTGRFLPSTFDRIPGAKNSTLVMATECNDSWKFMRSLSHNSIYSTRAIRLASGVRRAKADEMVGFLRAHKVGRAVNLEDVVSAAFTNIISNILTSKNLFHAGGEGEGDEEARRFFKGVVEKVTSTLGFVDLFPAMRGFDFWNKRKGLEFYNEVQLIWNDVIEERRAMVRRDDQRVQSDYLDVLNEHGFSDGHIGLLLTEQLLAATDSSTVTAVWLMSELVKNRDILHKVRDEIEGKAVNYDGTLDESLLSECRYFQACLKETLRVHITGPFLLPRRATETFCTSDSFTIPKDSIVAVNAWAIHTSSEYWEDPTRFDPTRFTGTKKFDYKGTHNFEFVPFGAGQRMCPGWDLAVKGIQLLVASLIIYFDWALPDGVDPTQLDITDRFGTTLKKDQPLRLIPTPRDKYVID